MNFRQHLTKKRIIWSTMAILVVGFIGFQVFGPEGAPKGTITENARVQDLRSSVLATGQVTSSTDLNLSFKGSGIVRRVAVRVGDKVKAGQLLANLDQRDQVAALTSARGSLASANANYQRVIDGNSSEEVAVALVAYNNAVAQQDAAVDNARRAYHNSSLQAVADRSNTSTYVPDISGTYLGDEEGEYVITRIFQSIKISGLESVSRVNHETYLPVPIGSKGLYAEFSDSLSERTSINDQWIIEIPNRRASDYVTNYNAYLAAQRSYDAVIATAQANLDLAKAKARPADLAAARAQILSAQGQVQSAQAQVEATEIRSPSAGTATKIDIKVGEVASSLEAAIVVQDVGSLYLEADVSEANVAELKAGQEVEVTFDALGPDKKYRATVSSIDPASTVVSGVVNYRTKAILDPVSEIKPGMTANMSILTGAKPAVLSAPIRAVIAKDGKKFVRVVTDAKSKAFTEKEVTTGFEGDGGLVEITSGLSEGQEIITFSEE